MRRSVAQEECDHLAVWPILEDVRVQGPNAIALKDGWGPDCNLHRVAFDEEIAILTGIDPFDTGESAFVAEKGINAHVWVALAPEGVREKSLRTLYRQPGPWHHFQLPSIFT